jgi:hypothetical protein
MKKAIGELEFADADFSNLIMSKLKSIVISKGFIETEEVK